MKNLYILTNVIGPHLFQNAASDAETVKGIRYCGMLTKFLLPDLKKTWLGQTVNTLF